jgi:uncharacterized protein
MERDFRGSGFSFPIFPVDGSLQWLNADDNVVQSIRLLLSTISGERIMRPTFGTRAAEFLFQGDSEQNRRQLELAVSDAITEFEPRVEVAACSSRTIEGVDGIVEVEVTVRVLRTNTLRNLVFPYYLNDIAAGSQ